MKFDVKDTSESTFPNHNSNYGDMWKHRNSEHILIRNSSGWAMLWNDGKIRQNLSLEVLIKEYNISDYMKIKLMTLEV